MNAIEIFRAIVESDHSTAALEFWWEHFRFTTGWPSDREHEEQQRQRLDECRQMIRWLRSVRPPILETDDGGLMRIASSPVERWRCSAGGIYHEIFERVHALPKVTRILRRAVETVLSDFGTEPLAGDFEVECRSTENRERVGSRVAQSDSSDDSKHVRRFTTH
jgi:hypothetical protein